MSNEISVDLSSAELIDCNAIIFLDIDGVLNSTAQQLKFAINNPESQKVNDEGSKSFYDFNFDKECMDLLNDLCIKIKAKVVITSSWRIGRSLEEMREILKLAGAKFEIIDMIKNLLGSVKGITMPRGVEIYEWLIRNHLGEFNRYVILDDDSDMLLWQKDNFFQTDGYVGLTPTICYKIERYINSLA